jgi:hypothetical protein
MSIAVGGSSLTNASMLRPIARRLTLIGSQRKIETKLMADAAIPSVRDRLSGSVAAAVAKPTAVAVNASGNPHA